MGRRGKRGEIFRMYKGQENLGLLKWREWPLRGGGGAGCNHTADQWPKDSLATNDGGGSREEIR